MNLSKSRQAVSEYEKVFRESADSRYAFSFYSGRAALYAILKALGVGQGDEVVIPAFTCIAVPVPIILLGAKPVYADVKTSTLNLDKTTLESAVTQRTKVVVFQHTFGMPEGIEETADVCKQRKIHLIEDCSQGLGVRCNGKQTGQWGLAAFFSSHWSKTYSTGVGGMLTTNDEKLAAAIGSQMSNHVPAPLFQRRLLDIQVRMFDAFFSPSIFWAAYRIQKALAGLGLTPKTMDEPPEPSAGVPAQYRYRLSGFQARVGAQKVSGLAQNLAQRQKWGEFYRKELAKRGFAVHGRFNDTALPYLEVPVLVKNKQNVIESARSEGIPVFDWPASPVYPLSLENTPRVGYVIGSCPNAQRLSTLIIGLPTNNALTRRLAEKIVEFLVKTGQIL